MNLDTIPSKMLRESSDICAENLLKVWNNQILGNKIFPQELKLANVTPIIKKDDSPKLCEHRKRFSTHDALVRLVEK